MTIVFNTLVGSKSTNEFVPDAPKQSLMKIWIENERAVSLQYLEDQKKFNATVWTRENAPVDIEELTECYETIVGIPEQLKFKSDQERKLFFSHTHHNLVAFGKGYKIYIKQDGIGGVLSPEDIFKLSDSKMARAIHEQIPDRTFTAVMVQSEIYQFQNGLKEVPAKAIKFKLDGYDRFFKGLKAALAGMGILNPNQYDKINEELLKTQVICGVKNVKTNVSEIEKAASQCAQCDSFTVYIAADFSNAELVGLKNDAIQATFRLTGLIKYLVEKGISLMKQFKEANG